MQRCLACEGVVKPLSSKLDRSYLKQTPGWVSIKNKRIQRDFQFKNFVQALHFANAIGRIAEKENHHPDILLHSWNKLKITLYTHALKGLSLNDFIIAGKINNLKSNTLPIGGEIRKNR